MSEQIQLNRKHNSYGNMQKQGQVPNNIFVLKQLKVSSCFSEYLQHYLPSSFVFSYDIYCPSSNKCP